MVYIIVLRIQFYVQHNKKELTMANSSFVVFSQAADGAVSTTAAAVPAADASTATSMKALSTAELDLSRCFYASAEDVRDSGSISGLGKPPEEGMATHFSILAWRIPWTEEPGGLCKGF